MSKSSQSAKSDVESVVDEKAQAQKAYEKQLEKEKRKAEYERLGLRDKTVFGVGGMSWSG